MKKFTWRLSWPTETRQKHAIICQRLMFEWTNFPSDACPYKYSPDRRLMGLGICRLSLINRRTHYVLLSFIYLFFFRMKEKIDDSLSGKLAMKKFGNIPKLPWCARSIELKTLFSQVQISNRNFVEGSVELEGYFVIYHRITTCA